MTKSIAAGCGVKLNFWLLMIFAESQKIQKSYFTSGQFFLLLRSDLI